MKKLKRTFSVFFIQNNRISLIIASLVLIGAFVPSTIEDFFLPGSQPGDSGNLEHPGKCDNCHGNYDKAVEPAFNWRGSMMAQAARDPLFHACLAISNQDVPESGDLCIRCHAPDGWLNGRSEPTDGSALNNNDMEGVQCDFCHKLVKPSTIGNNLYPDDLDYTALTYTADQEYLATLVATPPESGNGMYVVDANNAKRGPFLDAAARHKMYYSPFHSESGICGTCHDVSNPAFNRQTDGSYTPNEFGMPSPTFETYSMFPVERTYSEWLNSDYNTEQGVYAPQFGGNKDYVSTCQDCHMKDISGYGCNKKGAPLRADLPFHDMTGGNTFIPKLVVELFPDDVNTEALDSGILRSKRMLEKAATLSLTTTPNTSGYIAQVRVVNQTGHKLPSGYPEGRRIWINIRAYDASNNLVYASGEYNKTTATLIHDDDIKVYEIKPGISDDLATITGLSAGPSFHFVVNNQIYSDNRIPPRGFTNAAFEYIQSPPVGYSYADGQFWDDTYYQLPSNATTITANLYYQTLSKEYVTFLRDENITNDAGNILYNLWEAHGMSEPVLMTSTSSSMAQPIAEFTSNVRSGIVPLTVDFLDLSTNSPDSWLWNFGDGSQSTLTNPSHTYNTPGNYSVSLKVSNSYGTATLTKTDYISVIENINIDMYVSNIEVSRVSLKGGRIAAKSIVTVMGIDGNPVSNSLVTVNYTGPTSGTVSGTTNGIGIVELLTKPIKNTNVIWCFTVTNIEKQSFVYNPQLDIINNVCEVNSTIKSVEMDNPITDLSMHCFPNPFTDIAHINIQLPQKGYGIIEVYNSNGQVVKRLANQKLESGENIIIWHTSAIKAGIYYCKLKVNGETTVITLIKAK